MASQISSYCEILNATQTPAAAPSALKIRDEKVNPAAPQSAGIYPPIYPPMIIKSVVIRFDCI